MGEGAATCWVGLGAGETVRAEGTKGPWGPVGGRGPSAPSPPPPPPCGSVRRKLESQPGTWLPGGPAKGVRRRCHSAPVRTAFFDIRKVGSLGPEPGVDSGAGHRRANTREDVGAGAGGRTAHAAPPTAGGARGPGGLPPLAWMRAGTAEPRGWGPRGHRARPWRRSGGNARQHERPAVGALGSAGGKGPHGGKKPALGRGGEFGMENPSPGFLHSENKVTRGSPGEWSRPHTRAKTWARSMEEARVPSWGGTDWSRGRFVSGAWRALSRASGREEELAAPPSSQKSQREASFCCRVATVTKPSTALPRAPKSVQSRELFLAVSALGAHVCPRERNPGQRGVSVSRRVLPFPCCFESVLPWLSCQGSFVCDSHTVTQNEQKDGPSAGTGAPAPPGEWDQRPASLRPRASRGCPGRPTAAGVTGARADGRSSGAAGPLPTRPAFLLVLEFCGCVRAHGPCTSVAISVCAWAASERPPRHPDLGSRGLAGPPWQVGISEGLAPLPASRGHVLPPPPGPGPPVSGRRAPAFQEQRLFSRGLVAESPAHVRSVRPHRTRPTRGGGTGRSSERHPVLRAPRRSGRTPRLGLREPRSPGLRDGLVMAQGTGQPEGPERDQATVPAGGPRPLFTRQRVPQAPQGHGNTCNPRADRGLARGVHAF
ncbi:collagen alpha-1(I) chain-like [Hippopotamus amphibius kiboko]|uniref:collagen alpha-1(I) chain-like n=1 Tax=Hippopotamus amphibius kiboko TaxID=575201 RepID=UPI00259A198C|nr:collagen alpha-1(I) chain-like [Hippopotamus amphibius kiboko]